MTMFFQSLQLMVYGLTGVFFALAVLYAAVVITSKIFPYREENSKN